MCFVECPQFWGCFFQGTPKRKRASNAQGRPNLCFQGKPVTTQLWVASFGQNPKLLLRKTPTWGVRNSPVDSVRRPFQSPETVAGDLGSASKRPSRMTQLLYVYMYYIYIYVCIIHIYIYMNICIYISSSDHRSRYHARGLSGNQKL